MNTNELMNSFLANSKAAMEPMRSLGEVNKAALEAAAQHQVSLTKMYMDFGTRNVKLMASAREPRALVDEQLNLAKEFGDQLLAGAETYSKLAAEYQQELTEWTEKTAGEAAGKAEQAVNKAV